MQQRQQLTPFKNATRAYQHPALMKALSWPKLALLLPMALLSQVPGSLTLPPQLALRRSQFHRQMVTIWVFILFWLRSHHCTATSQPTLHSHSRSRAQSPLSLCPAILQMLLTHCSLPLKLSTLQVWFTSKFQTASMLSSTIYYILDYQLISSKVQISSSSISSHRIQRLLVQVKLHLHRSLL